MSGYVNAGLYQQWNFNTNTQSINMDAVNHERDRQAFIAADMQRGPRAPRLSKIQLMMRDEVEPMYARIRSQSTQLSPFHVQFEGRSYTLPPVSKQEEISMTPEEKAAHFSGLGYTVAMDLSDVAASRKMHALNAAKLKGPSTGKGLFKKFKKTALKPAEAKLYSFMSKQEFFNDRLAEARVPMRWELLPSNENPNEERWFILTPSGETGQPALEMAKWADRYWKNIPYKPWRDEIIEMPESAMWGDME